MTQASQGPERVGKEERTLSPGLPGTAVLFMEGGPSSRQHAEGMTSFHPHSSSDR